MWAAHNGHAECVTLLLSVSDPKTEGSFALRWAAKFGHVECVRLLLPSSDARACDSQALSWATIYGHGECARLLIPESGQLCEMDGLLENVMKLGQVRVAALLIEAEPRLLDGVDLSKCLAEALKEGRGDLASYLSAIMDQRELLEVGGDAAACGGRANARL